VNKIDDVNMGDALHFVKCRHLLSTSSFVKGLKLNARKKDLILMNC
jgi:hypothetical protein